MGEAKKFNFFKKLTILGAIFCALVFYTNAFAANYGSGTYGSNTYSVTSSLTYTLTGPTSGALNAPSANFILTPGYSYTGTITLSDGSAGGTFSSPSLTFSNSVTAQTFTYTPTIAGSITITASASPALNDISPVITYVSQTIPGIPSAVTATPEDASAIVSFTPPSDGGSPVTRYTITATPGNSTATGTTSPITITGLTNGTAYAFTVTAQNALGSGSSSVSSSPVTPVAAIVVPPPTYGGGGTTGGGATNPIVTETTPPTTSSTVTTPSTEPVTGECTNGALYSFLTGFKCPETSTPTATAVSVLFTKNLSFGMYDPEVKTLQKYLNSKGYIVAKTGAGAIGHETIYFGLATKTAVIKFQKYYKLTPDGVVGPLTRSIVQKNS